MYVEEALAHRLWNIRANVVVNVRCLNPLGIVVYRTVAILHTLLLNTEEFVETRR